MNYSKAWSKKIAERKQQGLFRQSHILETAQGTRIRIAGKSFLNFSSNDYLGLAGHPSLVKAMKQAVEKWGVGSGAAHLISGHTQVHHELEERLADFLGVEKALLFSTGYMANLGVVSALTDRHTLILGDQWNHASLVDAAKLSDAKFYRYAHNDPEQIKQKILAANKKNTLILTDAIFSMDGDIALLNELVDVAAESSSLLMIDDAHGFGVLGSEGRGTADSLKLQQRIPIYMATLGKAIGTAGAFVAGSSELIDYLVQYARTYIYTTAMPASIAAATLAALDILLKESWRQERVLTLAKKFRQNAEALGFKLLPSITPIQPILLEDIDLASRFSAALLAEGIWVPVIRPPTVPLNTARLRFTFSAEHTDSDLMGLLNTLEKLAIRFL